MADGIHSKEQGQRVHYLANVGGLAAIAGIDNEPPDLLLGVFIQIARRLPELTTTQRATVAAEGRAKLNERASAKRAWTAWQRNNDLHTVILSSRHLEKIIAAFGRIPPKENNGLETALMKSLEERP
jgi:hypothetical protein